MPVRSAQGPLRQTALHAERVISWCLERGVCLLVRTGISKSTGSVGNAMRAVPLATVLNLRTALAAPLEVTSFLMNCDALLGHVRQAPTVRARNV